jgi:hypothetical protein
MEENKLATWLEHLTQSSGPFFLSVAHRHQSVGKVGDSQNIQDPWQRELEYNALRPQYYVSNSDA